jgi:hypothetical protein
MTELACAVLSLDAERGLERAVRSILDQDGRVEAVVVNSGRPVDSERLRRLDVPVVEHPRRLLPGGVRNLAVASTRSPYVSFLAADCVALQGWVAGRLREHREGAGAVASVLVSDQPQAAALAGHLLLHRRRMPGTPPRRRLRYGLSYDRSLLVTFGPFREDLRVGEDSDLNDRLVRAGIRIACPDDVATAHCMPSALPALLADLHRRGARRAIAEQALRGRSRRATIATQALAQPAYGLRYALQVRDRRERRALLRACPLLVPGALALATGALKAPSFDPTGEPGPWRGPQRR